MDSINKKFPDLNTGKLKKKVKMIKQIVIPALIFMLIFSVQCTYDSEEELFPQLYIECDLENVNYSNTVKGILENNCYVCHSNQNSDEFGSGLKLEDYSDLNNVFTIVLGAVNHEEGFPPMPKNQQKLDKCQLDQLAKWDENGKPNN